MEERYEIIDFKNIVPAKVFLHKIGNVNAHWHNAIEILYDVEGEVDVTVNNVFSKLEENDLILINSCDVHSLYSKNGATLIAVQIDYQEFLKIVNDKSLRLNVNSTIDKTHEKELNKLRKDIITLIRIDSLPNKYGLKNLIYLNSLLDNLTENFIDTTSEIKINKNLGKLKEITQYINDHYNENLSLEDVSDKAGVTPQYFSSFFKKNVGLSFLDYYSSVRLEKTLRDLMNCDDSIIDVAFRNGYDEPRTFVRAFKKKYGLLPSDYRKTHSFERNTDSAENVNYLKLSEDTKLNALSKFFKNADNFTLAQVYNDDSHPKDKVEVNIDPNNVIDTATNISNVSVGVGRAKELLIKDVQDTLLDAVRDIGFRFVNFHGMFNDEMMVLTLKDGKPFYSFVMLDNVYDFLEEHGLKPIVQFDFMPSLIAKNKYNTLFDGSSIVSLPENLIDWVNLLEAFLQHIIYRYGLVEVQGWIYSLWNEPDSEQGLFKVGTPQEFFDFYKVTYDTLNKFIPGIKFAGPPLLFSSEYQKKWTIDFLKLCKINKRLPAFLEVHYYHNIYDKKNGDNTNSNELFLVGKHGLSDYYKSLKEMMRGLDIDLPLYLGEFNATFSHRNYINDTLFNGDFFILNYIDNYKNFKSYTPWCLTDYILENAIPDTFLHGGLGLTTYSNCKKPSYFAYSFLSNLKNKILAVGDNYMVTMDDKQIIIVAHNYKQYNEKYRTGERYNVTATSRYSIFDDSSPLEIEFHINHIDSKYVVYKKLFVNRKEGSVYDEWIKEGAFKFWNKNEIKSLYLKSVPGYRQQTLKVSNNSVTFSTILDPLEFQLIILLKKDHE
jgi:xylan 1,4-beta-xylosidase